MNFPEWIGDLTADQRETVFGTEEGQLGFAILRMPVSPDRSDWTLQIETARHAHEAGAIVFASPWSPPPEMCETFRREAPVGTGSYSEAESGTVLDGGTVSSDVEGASGGASVLLDGAGASVTWPELGMGTAGPKRVTVHYHLVEGPVSVQVMAQGAIVIDELELPDPGTPDGWGAVEVDVALEAGDNTLALTLLDPGQVAIDGIRIGGIQIQDDAQRLRRDSYADYAQHLSDFVTSMADHGVPLAAISIQNEPDYASDWTWWTPEEMVAFLRDHAASINCPIIAPESFQYVKATSDPIIRDDEAWEQVDILGSHLYGTAVEALEYPLFEERRGDRELWMTELYTPNSEADSNERWPEALEVGENIHHAFVSGGFQAYVWWYIRRSYGPLSEDGTISRRGHVMAHFSRFLREGSHRLDLEGAAPEGVRESAYRTAEGDVAIVSINNSDSSVTRPYHVLGTRTKRSQSWRTSATERYVALGEGAVRGGKVTVELPARSITTTLVH